jgi:mono/diheme cytochrome c family protein
MKAHAVIVSMIAVASAAPFGAASAADAKQFFQDTCSFCHGASGEGIPNLAPPLKGNKFITEGDVKAIAETITKGRAGAQKHYKELASPMPPQSVSGKQLDDLITFLRTDLQK